MDSSRFEVCERRARCVRSRQRCVAVRSRIGRRSPAPCRPPGASRPPARGRGQWNRSNSSADANSRWRPVTRFSRRPGERAGRRVAAQLQHVGAAVRVLGFRVQHHCRSGDGEVRRQRRPIPRSSRQRKVDVRSRVRPLATRRNRDLSLTTRRCETSLASPPEDHEHQAHSGTDPCRDDRRPVRLDRARLHRGHAGRVRDRDRELAALRVVHRPPAARPRQARAPSIFTCAITVFVLAPMVFACWALLAEAHSLLSGIAAADSRGVAVPEWLANVPVVGPWLAARWQSQLAAPGRAADAGATHRSDGAPRLGAVAGAVHGPARARRRIRDPAAWLPLSGRRIPRARADPRAASRHRRSGRNAMSTSRRARCALR